MRCCLTKIAKQHLYLSGDLIADNGGGNQSKAKYTDAAKEANIGAFAVAEKLNEQHENTEAHHSQCDHQNKEVDDFHRYKFVNGVKPPNQD